MTRVIEGIAGLRAAIGETLGPSAPLVIDQLRIDRFADATDDHQWIHVDIERAGREASGTIAHGMLTLSLIVPFVTSLYSVAEPVAINYGFDRVRFLGVVPVDSILNATVVIAEVEAGPKGTKVRNDVTISAQTTGVTACAVSWWTFYPTLTEGES